MQSFSIHFKEWWQTVVGMCVLVAVSTIAISTVFLPKANNALNTSDVNSVVNQAPAVSTPANTAPQTTTPARMIMPSVDLALDIIDSTVQATTNDWPLSETNAHFANFTPKLGSQKGTMLLYGHNTPQVMRKTSDIKTGDTLTIVDNQGTSWQFTMTNEAIVKPENVGFIYEDVSFRIVIFTCNGWNDEYRRLMYFEPLQN